jgi:hypothetical protein
MISEKNLRFTPEVLIRLCITLFARPSILPSEHAEPRRFFCEQPLT